ncbi:MAG: VWA domain-containing protein [Flavobacteriales bacterium]|nr:VWA domain-containing protein [Flavobacteriales bacterium]MDW8432545.1 VWA domain-containing protein [Flavobacteriales bacterium]
MTFERPEWLHAFWAFAPMVALVFWRMWRRKKLRAAWVDEALQAHNMPHWSANRPWISAGLLIIAYILTVCTAAGPRWGTVEKMETRTVHDIIVALDVSKSMLAEDLKPNRLERAKLSIKNLIRRRKQDRFGLVIFAGTAAVQLPLTTDKAAADQLIDKVSTESLNVGGTHISAALQRCLQAFGPPGQAARALILITDGEDHEEGALEAAKELAGQGIRIFTIGLGNPEGVPIPVYVQGRFQGYKTDAEGRTVVTRLNEALLRELAAVGGGMYVSGNDLSRALDLISEEIDRLDHAEITLLKTDGRANRFYYFAAFGLLILLLEHFLPGVRRTSSKTTSLFD